MLQNKQKNCHQRNPITGHMVTTVRKPLGHEKKNEMQSLVSSTAQSYLFVH